MVKFCLRFRETGKVALEGWVFDKTQAQTQARSYVRSLNTTATKEGRRFSKKQFVLSCVVVGG